MVSSSMVAVTHTQGCSHIQTSNSYTFITQITHITTHILQNCSVHCCLVYGPVILRVSCPITIRPEIVAIMKARSIGIQALLNSNFKFGSEIALLCTLALFFLSIFLRIARSSSLNSISAKYGFLSNS
mmetsp:Transcript_27968/g.41308  ORF Transcript_27968/g.41308 Transcript_27968/m.41308 type:complete len:128 (-) Transcript_27968:1609-1992(-)